MAEGASAVEDLATRCIDVNILSQLPHPHGTIHFPTIRAGTTVLELKNNVQNFIPSQSSPESMRLIHHGRVLARDSDTLIDVFGREAIQHATTHTLHLVIRDQPQHAGAPRIRQNRTPSIDVSSLAAQAPEVHPPAGHPASGPHIPQNTSPHIQSHFQALQANMAHRQQLRNAAASTTNTPVVLQQTPFGAPSAPPPIHPLQGSTSQQTQQPGLIPPTVQGMPDLHSIIQQQIQHAIAASQQHARSLQPAHGDVQHGQTFPFQGHAGTTEVNEGSAEARAPNDSVSSATGSPADSITQNNTLPESITRHGVGPNGERWTFTSSTSTSSSSQLPHRSNPQALTQANFPAQISQIAHGGFHRHNHVNIAPGPNPLTSHTAETGMEERLPGLAVSYPGWLGPNHAVEYMRNLQAQFESAMHSYRTPTATHSGLPLVANDGLAVIRTYIQQRNRAQQVINYILAQTHPSVGTTLTTEHVAELQSLHDRFRNTVDDWMRNFQRMRSSHHGANIPSSSQTSLEAPNSATTNTVGESHVSEPDPTSHRSEPGSNTVTAYLLNSPSGPRAILYSQEGVFSSRSRLQRRAPSHLGRGGTGTAQATATTEAQQRREGGQQLLLPNQEQRARVPLIPDLPQEGGPNAIAFNLTPFFQAAWFFVRGYAFMWLFLGGRGTGGIIFSWRSVLLLALSVAYGAVQAGIGTEQIALVRRYWNGLVGTEPEAGQRERAREAERDGEPGQRQRPEPEAGSQTGGNTNSGRVQQERRSEGEGGAGNEAPRGQAGPLREWLRPFERTIALFLASLYPGVGERHVAERDQARRDAEERDRARAASAVTQDASATDMSNTRGEEGPSEQQSPEQSHSSTEHSSSVAQSQGSPNKRASGTADEGDGGTSFATVEESQDGGTGNRQVSL